MPARPSAGEAARPAARAISPSPDTPSRLALPAAIRVRLPISDLKARCLGFAPAHAGRRHRVRVLAVEDEHDAVVAGSIRRYLGAVDEETHAGTVGIAAVS